MSFSTPSRFLWCFLLVSAALLSNAQVRKPDLLYKKDKSIIETIIVEVSDNEILYRRFDNPQGPIQSIKKSNVAKIVYTNGETEELIEPDNIPNKTTDKKIPEKPNVKSTTPKEKEVAKAKPAKAAEPEDIEEKKHTFKVKLGLRAGVNNSGLASDSTGFAKNMAGVHGGFVFKIGGNKFSVQPELLYSQLGSKIEYDRIISGSRNFLKAKVVFNTVTVPVWLNLTLGESKKEDNALRVILSAGGYASYLLNAKTTGTTSSNGEPIQDINLKVNKDQMGFNEFGAAAGLGINYTSKRTEVFLDGRYYRGLSSSTYQKINGQKVSTDANSFQNIQIGFGVMISLW